MNGAQLTYGEAKEVSDYLSEKNGVTQDELHSALINALNRIHHLEKRVEQQRQEIIRKKNG